MARIVTRGTGITTKQVTMLDMTGKHPEDIERFKDMARSLADAGSGELGFYDVVTKRAKAAAQAYLTEQGLLGTHKCVQLGRVDKRDSPRA